MPGLETERDGRVETHVEHRVTIHSDLDLDHDAVEILSVLAQGREGKVCPMQELSKAIMEATKMNPNMTVEKIEVKQESQC